VQKSAATSNNKNLNSMPSKFGANDENNENTETQRSLLENFG